MTPAQIQLVQVAKRQLQLEDGLYRQILAAYGDGVKSCTDLTTVGFERVMAFFESRGFRFDGHRETYFRDLAALRDRFASPQQVRLIQELSAKVQRYPLDSLCRRRSGGRATEPSKLTPQQAWDLIEQLKSMAAREAAKGVTDDKGNEGCPAADSSSDR